MDTYVINVGNELLSGKTENTHLKRIAEMLHTIGMNIKEAFIVADHQAAIERVLKRIDEGVIILTGGLGPTANDQTKETVFNYYGLTPVLHHESLVNMRNHFKQLGIKMPKVNEKQAYFPESATVLNNLRGTAPGAIFNVGNQTVILLPGPPQELETMLPEVSSYLKEHYRLSTYEASYLLVGKGESAIEDDLKILYDKYPEVAIASYANLAEIRYIFTSKNKHKMQTAMDEFRQMFTEYIVGDGVISLEKHVFNLLDEHNHKISFAESCTAGMVASRLVNVADASRVFDESLILYSNGSKIKHLGVNQMIIEQFGAVSDQCVYELAYQLAQRTRSDITLSVSGIAGPSGGTPDKPIGTVYYGIYYQDKTKTYHKIFTGDRQMIRAKATTYGLYLIWRTLHENTHQDA